MKRLHIGGFTLLELMIASSIAMIVMLSLISIMLSQQNAISATVSKVRSVQTSHAIYDLLDSTLNHSAYQGCSNASFASQAVENIWAISNSTSDGKAQDNAPDFPDSIGFYHTRSDALDVKTLKFSGVELYSGHKLANNSSALLVSCSHTLLVELIVDKNSNLLSFKYPINTAKFNHQRISLVPLMHSQLYIDKQRLMIKHDTSPAFEISSDIENLQLLYQADNANGNSFVPYLKLTELQRSQINAVQFHALISQPGNTATPGNKSYPFAGNTYTSVENAPPYRQEVSGIIVLRNRQ